MGWLSGLVETVRTRLARRRRAPAPAGQHATIAALLERMHALDDAMTSEDGVRAFHRMYLRVTEIVRDRIEEGYFSDAELLTRLDIVFAGLYLEALDAAEPNRAWAPLFEDRSLGQRLPIQFALAGMNAHINHDLPVALVRTCRQLGIHPGTPGVREDYRRVTDVLAAVQEEVRQSFLAGLALDVDRRYAPVANLVGAWSIGRARDAAWTNAGVLWELEGLEPLRGDYLETLSRSVGMAGRYLLTPVADLP